MSETKTLGKGKTTHAKLQAWVKEMIELCQPANVWWCDGSDNENTELCGALVRAGTFTRLNEAKRPGCYLARSHPSDVARVEDDVERAFRRVVLATMDGPAVDLSAVDMQGTGHTGQNWIGYAYFRYCNGNYDSRFLYGW